MQNLIDESIFTELYNTLLEEFKSANSEQLYNLYLETHSKVKDWKYATDTYFTIRPYDNEINNLKRGKLLKSADTNNPKIRVNTFGFDDHNNLILAEWPFSNDAEQYGYSTSCNLHLAEGVKTYAIHRYIENRSPSAIVSISIFKSIGDTTKISLTVNGIRSNHWLLQVYHYSDNGVLQKIDRHDPTFNLTVEFNMIYDENGLEKITNAVNSIIWKRK